MALQDEMNRQLKMITALQDALEKEKKEKEKLKECAICFERVERLMGFLHGGTVHVCACDSCAKKVSKCPICNQSFQNILKVF